MGNANEWQWDPSLYSGSAAYYTQGRVAYPTELAEGIADALGLDGSGRLLDVGCGPGSLTLQLAGKVGETLGIDADADMLAEAARRASGLGLTNVRWLQMRAEELPADLGQFDAVTFAQSFHWLDRLQVARTVRGMLAEDGACVQVHATTHTGIDEATVTLPYPQPPRAAIAELIERYLGAVRRAGQGTLPAGTAGGESDIFRAAGFVGPHSIEIPGRVITRTVDDLVAALFSLSSSAPHLFGASRASFETDLRQLLIAASPSGLFSEQMREIAVDIWHND